MDLGVAVHDVQDLWLGKCERFVVRGHDIMGLDAIVASNGRR
jgi:hypothetical protein